MLLAQPPDFEALEFAARFAGAGKLPEKVLDTLTGVRYGDTPLRTAARAHSDRVRNDCGEQGTLGTPKARPTSESSSGYRPPRHWALLENGREDEKASAGDCRSRASSLATIVQTMVD